MLTSIVRYRPCYCVFMSITFCLLFFFFFNDTATTEIYTLSLHDALPIWERTVRLVASTANFRPSFTAEVEMSERSRLGSRKLDRKSTRLNSSHANISYAVFCLKKKKKIKTEMK